MYNELYHHGILGQRWGVRRYQNSDGTYTDEGLKRKATKSDSSSSNSTKKVSYDDAQRYYMNYADKKDSNTSHTEQIQKKMNKELAPYIEKLKKTKYGSDEWFELRDEYYKKMDSFGKEWTEATLKDMNISLKNAKDNEQFSKWIGVGEGYLNSNSDYREITDPVTGDRDYDLKPSQNYIDKKQIKTISSKTDKSESEAKKIQKDIKDSEKQNEVLEKKYWDLVVNLTEKYNGDSTKIYSDPQLVSVQKEQNKIKNDLIKLYKDNGLWITG